MNKLDPCPKCQSTYTYVDVDRFCCPECGYDWIKINQPDEPDFTVSDANGTPLQDGDCVTLIKDLKVKGTSSTIKVGTKVKINRLVDSGHNIECKVSGIGAMKLKSEFVKKFS